MMNTKYTQNYIENEDRVEGKLSVLMYIYFAISFWEPYLNGVIGSVTKYYVLILIAVIVFRNSFCINIDFFSKCSFIWLIYKIISLLWSEDYSTPRLHFLSHILMVSLLIAIGSLRVNRKLIDGIINTCWISSGILGVLSVFFSNSYHNTVEARQTLVMFGVEIDPNNQAAFLLAGIAISAVYLFLEKKYRALSLIILLVNIYSCLLTASRAGFVTIVAISAFCVVATEKNGTIISYIRKFCIIGIIVILAYLIITRYLPEASFERIFSFSSYEGGSDRSRMWSNIWKLYTTDPFTILFGVGWGTATIYTGSSVAVHNTFLTMLCDVGLFGTAIFFVPYIYAAIKLFKNKSYTPVALFLAQMIPSFFIDAINKRFFWNAIIILVIYYRYINEIENADSEAEKIYVEGEVQ